MDFSAAMSVKGGRLFVNQTLEVYRHGEIFLFFFFF